MGLVRKVSFNDAVAVPEDGEREAKRCLRVFFWQTVSMVVSNYLVHPTLALLITETLGLPVRTVGTAYAVFAFTSLAATLALPLLSPLHGSGAAACREPLPSDRRLLPRGAPAAEPAAIGRHAAHLPRSQLRGCL